VVSIIEARAYCWGRFEPISASAAYRSDSFSEPTRKSVPGQSLGMPSSMPIALNARGTMMFFVCGLTIVSAMKYLIFWMLFGPATRFQRPQAISELERRRGSWYAGGFPTCQISLADASGDLRCKNITTPETALTAMRQKAPVSYNDLALGSLNFEHE
jgi:hypothetical protein